MKSKDLDRLLRKGSMKGCVKAFAGMEEADRRSLFPTVHDILGEASDISFSDSSQSKVRQQYEFWHRAALAALATGTMSELKKLGSRAMPWGREESIEVLRDRRPPWLTDWCGWLIDQQHHHWPLVRTLVRQGLCPPPETDMYYLGMISGLVGRGGGGIEAELLASPDLLDSHLWRLFELEGGGDLSLATHDKYGRREMTWEHALVALAKRGEIGRDRLLDASLDALNRDFAQFRVGWFSRFHEALGPTVEERIRRVDSYLGLLRSPIPPTVTFALKALKILHKEKKLAGRDFTAHAEPLFHAKAKGTVKTALGMLTDFAKVEAALAGPAILAAVAGLEHGDVEVQGASFKLVEALGDPSDPQLRAAVTERLGLVAPSLKGRVQAWLGDEAGGGDEAPALEDLAALTERGRSLPAAWARLAGVDSALEETARLDGFIPAAPFTGLEIPRLSQETLLNPVSTFDELLELFLQAIEQPNDVDRVELVLDGLARLGDQRPTDFERRTAPLGKRIASLRKRRDDERSWGRPIDILAILADAWLQGTVLDIRSGKRGEAFVELAADDGKAGRLDIVGLGVNGVFLLRALHVAQLVAGRQPGRLLSTPTHSGGWIEPLALLERTLSEPGREADLADQVLALLRLAPDGRDRALEAAKSLDGEWGAALRYALGGASESIGDSAPLWVAGARARAPLSDDAAVERKFPGLGPDAGTAARYAHRVEVEKHKDYTFYRFKLTVAPDPLRFDKVQSGEIWGRWVCALTADSYPTYTAWLPTVLAHSQPELFYYGNAGLGHSLHSPWAPVLWPGNREPLFACGAIDAASFDEQSRPNTMPPPGGYQAMLDADQPMLTMGRLMLCLGLNARDVVEGQLAADALIATLQDGRLDGVLLGATMRDLLFTGMIRPKRWAARFREAVLVSPLHAQQARHALETALQGEADRAPRDGHALMELLRELCIEAGEAVTQPETRAFLGGFSGASKAAKLARGLLALEAAETTSHRRAAAVCALADRIARAERWMAVADGYTGDAKVAP